MCAGLPVPPACSAACWHYWPPAAFPPFRLSACRHVLALSGTPPPRSIAAQWDVMSYANVFATNATNPQYGQMGPSLMPYHQDRLGWLPGSMIYTWVAALAVVLSSERREVPSRAPRLHLSQQPLLRLPTACLGQCPCCSFGADGSIDATITILANNMYNPSGTNPANTFLMARVPYNASDR
jgi:hypothetical protein